LPFWAAAPVETKYENEKRETEFGKKKVKDNLKATKMEKATAVRVTVRPIRAMAMRLRLRTSFSVLQ
jgi:hypothetical protein